MRPWGSFYAELEEESLNVLFNPFTFINYTMETVIMVDMRVELNYESELLEWCTSNDVVLNLIPDA